MPSGTKCLPWKSPAPAKSALELTQSPQWKTFFPTLKWLAKAGRMWQNSENTWVCLKIVYPYTQWFCWSLSLLNGYNWEYTQHFQTNPPGFPWFMQNYGECHSRLFPKPETSCRSRTKMRLPKSTQPMSGRCSFPPTCSVRSLVGYCFPNLRVWTWKWGKKTQWNSH